MKTTHLAHLVPILVLASGLGAAPLQAASSGIVDPWSSVFTYQGQLRQTGQPANGLFDFDVCLFDSLENPLPLLCALIEDDVPVQDGLFTLDLDFGVNEFDGAVRYLEIKLRDGDSTGDFTTLTPRQPLRVTPLALRSRVADHAMGADDASNAANLEGQPATFYRNAGNLSAGTLPDARLSANVALLGGAQTFIGAKTFGTAPAFTAAGAPFSVSSTTRVNNLNADRLDSFDSTAFALVSHNHDASAIVSGTLADARLPGSIPRLGQSNTFTTVQSVSVSTANVLNLASSGAGGSWLNLTNTSAGGRSWNLVATGSATAEGAGKLLVRDGTSSAVRATFDGTGQFGIGTTSPSARLEVFGADAQARLRNSNDIGGGFLMNSFGTLQLGLYNPTASIWGAIPASGQRSLFGVQNTGRVGTLSNTGVSPAWRNTLDDGNGNATFAGTVASSNFPRVKTVQTYRDVRDSNGGVLIGSNQSPDVDTISVNIPGPGVLHLRGTIQLRTVWVGSTAYAFFKLEDITGANVILNETGFGSATGGATALDPVLNVLHVEWALPVSAGTRSFKTSLYNNSTTTIRYYSTSLTATYLPGGL